MINIYANVYQEIPEILLKVIVSHDKSLDDYDVQATLVSRGDQAFYNELSVLRGINFMTLRLAKLQNVALHRLLNLL